MQIEDLAKVVHDLSKTVADGFKEMREGFKSVREEMQEQNNAILQAMSDHSTVTDARFDVIEKDLAEVKKTVANLPTKEYVDDKISTLRGEVVTIARETALAAIGAK